MKKSKVTRNLLAAFSIVALTAVVYGCSSGPSQSELDTETDRADQAEMQVAALQQQINALRAQLGLAPDDNLSDSVTDLQGQVDDLQQQVDDAAEEKRLAEEEAARKAAEEAAAAMAATAAKLYAGVSVPSGDPASPAATDRAGAYNADGTAIMVSIGDGTNTPTAVTLMEDEDTMVAANHGWEGKRYARTTPASEGMYEAVVYSNVEEPMQGDKFGTNGGGTGYQYTLAAGSLSVDTSSATTPASRVGGSSFDHSSGVKRFPLPDPNPTSQTVVVIPGSYHGVPGNFSCTPGAAVCAANVAAQGFQLGTVVSATDATFTEAAWTFTPTNAEARVMDAADTAYASYGWWLHKTENDQTYTASAFVDEMGTVADATGLNALNGKATYQGGAAGKYALASSTGGTNDAGHFTARATLEANFTVNDGTDTTTNGITGTLDMFIGADGMPRDWEVELMGSPITDTGGIGDTTDGTAWTIGDTAADASGQWSGNLRNNGTDGVPQVATGTFYTEYGTAGKMVGGFGANKQ